MLLVAIVSISFWEWDDEKKVGDRESVLCSYLFPFSLRKGRARKGFHVFPWNWGEEGMIMSYCWDYVLHTRTHACIRLTLNINSEQDYLNLKEATTDNRVRMENGKTRKRVAIQGFWNTFQIFSWENVGFGTLQRSSFKKIKFEWCWEFGIGNEFEKESDLDKFDKFQVDFHNILHKMLV